MAIARLPGSPDNLILPSRSAVFHTKGQMTHLSRPALAERRRNDSGVVKPAGCVFKGAEEWILYIFFKTTSGCLSHGGCIDPL